MTFAIAVKAPRRRSSGRLDLAANRKSHGAPARGAHLAILQLGVPIWNRWRMKEPATIPDLENVSLHGLDLENVNLCYANLSGADLSGCYLYDADFQEANLRQANLGRAGLIGANFHRADLRGANLKHAYLAQSDLSNADLSNACLQEASLQSALLTKARLHQTCLAKAELSDCFDLTASQLSAAQDAPLAFCTDKLRAELRFELSRVVSPSACELVKKPTIKPATEPAIKPVVSQPKMLRKWASVGVS